MIKPTDSAELASAEVCSNIVANIVTVPQKASLNQTRAVCRAAKRYLRRRDRTEHPAGKCDRAGRWYPDDSEKFDSRCYRSPSRNWPWSYMLACRTIAHCAKLEGIPELVREVRKAVRKLDPKAKLANQGVQTS